MTLPLSVAVLLLLLSACADGPPDSTPSPQSITPVAATADTVASDQIEHTLQSNPDAPVEEALPQTEKPVVKAPVKSPTPVAPPAPTNPAPAAPPSASTAATPPRPASDAPNHESWDALLRRHVSPSGRVDYVGFSQNSAQLDAYLDLLAKKTPGKSWSSAEALAYWINAYNAYTVKLILDNWPVKSIRDIDQPWDKRWIKLGTKTYSLNQIEHEIIRPTFKEPRIHFALVCAAESCPPLANRAYTASNLEQMLETRTRSFINDEKFNVTQEAVVRVSPLFDWYAQDFGDVKDYLNQYLTTDIPAGKELHFLEYDWSLND
ncbi:DUF547 domain-containing protein [Lewinella sp. JB7]|uniref:DUF547 domain-containing protein n=1 Tax=Lewinella sp. JB7 TaxID=2962887 RepID=UPI0020CA1665|nr:DUF547 domain-containing protein [Lewinella sp. JB7]MCP9235096.1 DUF547 domain-containing protein [Lewinella sp. JB7]